MGLGIGISAVVVPVYLGEVAPAQVTTQTIHTHGTACSTLARLFGILHDGTEHVLLWSLCITLAPDGTCLLTAPRNMAQKLSFQPAEASATMFISIFLHHIACKYLIFIFIFIFASTCCSTCPAANNILAWVLSFCKLHAWNGPANT